jgi:hypothetical protein
MLHWNVNTFRYRGSNNVCEGYVRWVPDKFCQLTYGVT